MTTNQNLTDEEEAKLMACKTSEEWTAACDAVKGARGGEYPPDWWPRMKLSGKMDRVLSSFGSSSDLKFTVLR